MPYLHILKNDTLYIATILGDFRFASFSFLCLSFVLYENDYFKVLKKYIFQYITVIVIIASAKFYHYICIDHKDYIALNPSGHIGLAIVVYSPFFFLLQNISNEYTQILIKFTIILFLCLIGISRYLLKFHTIEEIIVGAVIGFLVSFNILVSVIDNKRDVLLSMNLIYVIIGLALISTSHVGFSSEKIIMLIAHNADLFLDCS